MSKPVAKSLRLEADLARAVDVARGDVSWSRWVTRAIEDRLGVDQLASTVAVIVDDGTGQNVVADVRPGLADAIRARRAAEPEAVVVSRAVEASVRPVRREGESVVAFNIRRREWQQQNS